MWDQCYAFKNIFANNFCEKIGVLHSNHWQFYQTFDHNPGF
jgi:hypothetical protein